jgi:hypothetical protein
MGVVLGIRSWAQDARTVEGLLPRWVTFGTITNGPADNILTFSALASRPSTSEEISESSTPPDFSVLIRMLSLLATTLSDHFRKQLHKAEGKSEKQWLTPVCACSIG